MDNLKNISRILKKHSLRHFKTTNYWQDLGHKFLAQQGLCHYSGVRITLGQTASLDHKIPLSKGGPHSLENVCWCHKNINFMKHDLMPSEFDALLNEIVFQKSKILNTNPRNGIKS